MEERFWSKIDKKESNEECWEWLKALNKCGYGTVGIGNGKTGLAHRQAYQYHYKIIISNNLVVRHKCDNTKCCNPYHLELGTQLDNIKDRHERNRDNKPIGEINIKSKLTENQVLEIRNRNEDTKILAQLYNVSCSTINRIKSRKSWNHI